MDMKMNRTALLFALSLAVILTTGTGPAAGAEPAAPASLASVTVADFTWMTGTWLGEVNGSFVEEQWSAPAGGVLMGMFRAVQGGTDGKIEMYEFLTLEPGAEGPVLWLRHFNPKLVGWEDKEGAIAFHLAAYKVGEATFDNRDPKEPTRITYHRQGPNRLATVLDRTKDGKRTVTDFVYRRQ